MDKLPTNNLLKTEMTRKQFLQWLGLFVMVLFGFEGVIRMLKSHAATTTVSAEAEKGTLTSPATAVTDSAASSGKAVKFGPAITTPPPPPVVNNEYHPIVVSDPKQLPHAPQSANYVVWNILGVTYIDQAFAKLGSNDILVLPERIAPYEIDSSRGFINDPTHFYAMSRAKRGMVGLGPGALVQPSASSFHSGQATFPGVSNQNRMIDSDTPGSYFGNFEMRGRDFGGVQYDGIVQTGASGMWERIYFQGAHRGFMNGANGECGAVSADAGANQAVYNCEIDCRDMNGVRVGSSPLMFNNQSNVTVVDVYAHHAVAGMPTFWQVNNVSTTRLRSEHNGTGGGTVSGSGINHERVTGTVTHNSPTLLIDYGNPNTGLHISIDTINATFNIINPTFDAGPAGPGIFSIADWSGGNQSLLHVTNDSGGNVPFRVFN